MLNNSTAKKGVSNLDTLTIKKTVTCFYNESSYIPFDISVKEIEQWFKDNTDGTDVPDELEDNSFCLGEWDVVRGDGLNFPVDSLVVTEYIVELEENNPKFYFTMKVQKDDFCETYYKETDNDLNNENRDFYALCTGGVSCDVIFSDGSYLSFEGEDQNSFNWRLYESCEPKEDTIAYSVKQVIEDMPLNNNDLDSIVNQWREQDPTKTCQDDTCPFYSPNGTSYGSYCLCAKCIK